MLAWLKKHYQALTLIIFMLTALGKLYIYWTDSTPEPNSIPIAKLDTCLTWHKKCVKRVESLESCGHFRDFYIDLCEKLLYDCEKEGIDGKTNR